MADIDDLMTAGFDFLENLEKIKDTEERVKKIKKHIANCDSLYCFSAPNFPSDVCWFNVHKPLSWQDIAGKVVLLDFFTYCCVNCLHALEDLNSLESKYSVEDGLLVVGVHSAKFTNEKTESNVRNAVAKYGIKHPVINDTQCSLWNALHIMCWPTFVLLGPSHNVLLLLIGEGNSDILKEFVRTTLDYYREMNKLTFNSLDIIPESPEKNKSESLRFPGKITHDSDSDLLVISDSGHNRIVVCNTNGEIQYVVGVKDKGFKDGDFRTARFNSPQGVLVHRNMIYVADTGNHAIREIDLKEKKVVTLVGTGNHGRDLVGGKPGSRQTLSSPWDICFGSCDGTDDKNILYIAMAGTHQIWTLFLRDSAWYGPWNVQRGLSFSVVGSGAEQNKNDRDSKKAGLAQPSGVTMSPELGVLYFADSESSSVRTVTISDGNVKVFVGGEPRMQFSQESLFSFGDIDGVGYEARLQHPMGVALLDRSSGPLLIADTYNHKIKSVNLKTRQCTTIVGSGKCGNSISGLLTEVELNEPNGLTVDNRTNLVYVADTNNHEIKVFDLNNGSAHRMVLTAECESSSAVLTQTFKRLTLNKQPIHLSDVVLGRGGKINFHISIHWQPGRSLSKSPESLWQIFSYDEDLASLIQAQPLASGQILTADSVTKATLTFPDGFTTNQPCTIFGEIFIFYCDERQYCSTCSRVYVVDVTVDPQGSPSETIDISIEL